MAVVIYVHGQSTIDPYPLQPAIFNDIQEMNILSSYVTGEATDPNIGSQQHSGVKWNVKKDDHLYLVFGYAFDTVEDASQYSKQACGKTFLNNVGYTAYSSYWKSETEYIAQYNTNILYIKGGKYQEVVELIDWLGEHLSIQASDF